MERDTSLRAVEVREYTGNSEAVAQGYYSATTKEDRQRAARATALVVASGATVEDKSAQIEPDESATVQKSQDSRQKVQSELIRDYLEMAKVHPAGFEPATLGSEDRCAIQLCHGCVCICSPDYLASHAFSQAVPAVC